MVPHVPLGALKWFDLHHLERFNVRIGTTSTTFCTHWLEGYKSRIGPEPIRFRERPSGAEGCYDADLTASTMARAITSAARVPATFTSASTEPTEAA